MYVYTADKYAWRIFHMFRCSQVNDGPCTTYLGSIGSGNYVKMVHNGIEYGDMQLIAEVRRRGNQLHRRRCNEAFRT